MQPQPHYPPQQYPAAPPNQYPPTAYPGTAPQGYPTQPYGTQAAVAASLTPPQAMPGGDEFAGATPVVNVVRPRIMDIGPGRLLLLTPKEIKRVRNELDPNPNAMQDRLTADIVVLDGPPFPYGGKPEKGTPHTHTATTPMAWPGMWITQDLIVRQCEREITNGRKVLGRLVRGQASDPKRSAPWKLDEPTEADKQIARDYLAGRIVATMAPPQPAPVPQPTQQSVAPAPTWNPTTGQWEFAAQGPTHQPTAPGYPAAQVAQGYIGSPDPGAQYQPGPPPPQPNLDVPPAGMDPAIWAQMPPEMRAAVLASAAAPAHWQ